MNVASKLDTRVLPSIHSACNSGIHLITDSAECGSAIGVGLSPAAAKVEKSESDNPPPQLSSVPHQRSIHGSIYNFATIYRYLSYISVYKHNPWSSNRSFVSHSKEMKKNCEIHIFLFASILWMPFLVLQTSLQTLTSGFRTVIVVFVPSHDFTTKGAIIFSHFDFA
jgi:hypothetical protein